MQVALVAFPFRQTFRQLELEKKWWHRLLVVVFLSALICTAPFIGAVSYSSFAPRVSTIPNIDKCDIFDQASAEQQHQNIPDGGCLDISSGVVPVPSADVVQPESYTANGGRLVSKEDWFAQNAPKAFQPMIDPQGVVHQIPIDTVIEALEAGDKRVVTMYDPHGTKRWVPEDEIRDAIKAGGKIAEGVTPPRPPGHSASGGVPTSQLPPLPPGATPVNFSAEAKAPDKIIEMPDGSTSWFAGTVSDNAIRAKWNHAKTHQILKAVFFACLITTGVVLFINYLLQIAYRALLYVLFGAVVDGGDTASQSV